ncbi:MAG: proline--tRNA ligase [Candidatus Pacearchaeota archaeon]|nr:proline--tRNA ligase [Candidatus Pacearchaeota archaeon]
MQTKEEKKKIGITFKKYESKWFVEVLRKAELLEYSNVSGCYIFKPRLYFMWETIQNFFNEELKKEGVESAYFPLLIPETLLKKEKAHIHGFEPEVAWVTRAGNKELKEKLAIRPTSETIIYSVYAKWIRSWRDLPLRLNQWCNIVRWEFKNPIPLLRSREFLWQEGHSCFASKEEAEKEIERIIEIYEKVYEEILAVPVIKGWKTEKEKFPGAIKTLTLEIFLPSGKAIQGCTAHNLGQNFSKAFEIKFRDREEKENYVWQTSWGLSTRSIGIAIMMHSDDKGLVVSPKIANPQIVIIPIFGSKEKEKVLKEAEKIKDKLKEFRVELDKREYTPGYKFHDWELKGAPLRIEIGPKDIKNRQVVIVRRDSGKKEEVKVKEINKKIKEILDDIHKSLYKKAKEFVEKNTVNVENFQELIEKIKEKKLIKTEWCGKEKCEDTIKNKTKAKIICIFSEKINGRCVCCNENASYAVYVARSY